MGDEGGDRAIPCGFGDPSESKVDESKKPELNKQLAHLDTQIELNEEVIEKCEKQVEYFRMTMQLARSRIQDLKDQRNKLILQSGKGSKAVAR